MSKNKPVFKVYRLTFMSGKQYVGLTKKRVSERVQEHSRLSEACNKQLCELLQGEEPKIEILGSYTSRFIAYSVEQNYIANVLEQNRINICVKNAERRKNYGIEHGTRANIRHAASRRRRVRDVREGSYICSKCRVMKDHTQYYKDRTRFNGLHSRCKECSNAEKKNYTTNIKTSIEREF